MRAGLLVLCLLVACAAGAEVADHEETSVEPGLSPVEQARKNFNETLMMLDQYVTEFRVRVGVVNGDYVEREKVVELMQKAVKLVEDCKVSHEKRDVFEDRLILAVMILFFTLVFIVVQDELKKRGYYEVTTPANPVKRD